MKIKIKKSPEADTRTCNFSKVTKKQLLKSTKQHIDDVSKGLLFFVKNLLDSAIKHDHTKIDNIDMFHEDFKTGFKKTDWYEMHQLKERHHFKDPQYIQNDINLIDILEQIADSVMAGMARSGQFKQEPIDKELLVKAYNNTIKLLLDNVELDKK
jgi:hypothetical protein